MSGPMYRCQVCKRIVCAEDSDFVSRTEGRLTTYYHNVCHDVVFDPLFTDQSETEKYVLCPECEQEIDPSVRTIESTWRDSSNEKVSHFYHQECFKIHCIKQYTTVDK